MNGTEQGLPSIVQFVLQLGFLIIFTRIGGYWLRKWLRLPGVIGELLVGMIIGPYALGKFTWPLFGRVFDVIQGQAVSPELYAVSTFASIILLFLSGLETDLSTFLRYSVAGTVVGLGGVIFAFWLGAGCAIWFGHADSWLDPTALFLGAIATATSVGISARILTERQKMDSPEGVTILAAAVFDDVLGIIVLAIVVGMVRATAAGNATIEWIGILKIAGKAFGFWIGATAIGLLAARRFSTILKYFKGPESIAAVALGFALLLSGLSEMAGLAMIIGAYIMGLSLSRTDLVQVIHSELEGLHNILVPVFFGTMGMMVDFSGLAGPVLKVALIYSLLAVISKVAGCGLSALVCGFNRHGALRIGTGMLPRGEVALIVAGIGMASGAISKDVFTIAIMMTLVTTVLGPLFLSASFEGKESGLRQPPDNAEDGNRVIRLEFGINDMADFIFSRLEKAFRNEEFYVYRLSSDNTVCHIRKDDMVFMLQSETTEVTLTVPPQYETLARLIVVEEMLSIRSMLHMVEKGKTMEEMEAELVAGLFAGDDHA